jgi:hypothetical protein
MLMNEIERQINLIKNSRLIIIKRMRIKSNIKIKCQWMKLKKLIQ